MPVTGLPGKSGPGVPSAEGRDPDLSHAIIETLSHPLVGLTGGLQV